MTLQILDAVEDEDVLALDAEPEAEAPVEEKKPEAAPPPVVNPSAVADEIFRRLQATQPQTRRTSRLEAEIGKMVGEGVAPEAIEKILRLREAERADEAERAAIAFQQQNQAVFQQACWKVAEDALVEYSKNIPFLRSAKDGLKRDLLEEVSDLVRDSSEYSSLRAEMQNGKLPNREKVGQAVAKVVDKFCRDNQITKKAAPLEIKSSKAETSEKAFSEADVDKLSKGAKQIYASALKYTGDPKKALKRAQQYSAEVG